MYLAIGLRVEVLTGEELWEDTRLGFTLLCPLLVCFYLLFKCFINVFFCLDFAQLKQSIV